MTRGVTEELQGFLPLLRRENPGLISAGSFARLMDKAVAEFSSPGVAAMIGMPHEFVRSWYAWRTGAPAGLCPRWPSEGEPLDVCIAHTGAIVSILMVELGEWK